MNAGEKELDNADKLATCAWKLEDGAAHVTLLQPKPDTWYQFR